MVPGFPLHFSAVFLPDAEEEQEGDRRIPSPRLDSPSSSDQISPIPHIRGGWRRSGEKYSPDEMRYRQFLVIT